MTDGNIMAARSRFELAVRRLCAPQTCVHYDHTLSGPSLYEMLSTGLTARQGETRTPAQSLPPLWIDATQLLGEIDTQVRQWRPRPKATTPQRLEALTGHGWRPQDTEAVSNMARRVAGWCDSIVNLFDPEHRKYIQAPCPSCGKSIVHKRDTAGEIVRQPALVLVTEVGCTCQHCDAHWSPDRYLFLCRLLGFELPAGVLE